MPGDLDVPYGAAGPRQMLDIFTPETDGAPILVFIHGGYWFFNSKDPRRFPAREFVLRGIAWVPINYRLAPAVPMSGIVADVRNAVQWLYQHAAEYGCDPDRIYVSGNSAGGHLTAELLSDDWPEQYGLPADVVKGACAISGLYELEPLLECEPNEKLRLDLESARRYSRFITCPGRLHRPSLPAGQMNPPNSAARLRPMQIFSKRLGIRLPISRLPATTTFPLSVNWPTRQARCSGPLSG